MSNADRKFINRQGYLRPLQFYQFYRKEQMQFTNNNPTSDGLYEFYSGTPVYEMFNNKFETFKLPTFILMTSSDRDSKIIKLQKTIDFDAMPYYMKEYVRK